MATSQEKPVEQTESSSESTASQPTPQPKGSGNPDHQGGKVKSAQPDADGVVAPTDEEKGGSSE